MITRNGKHILPAGLLSLTALACQGFALADELQPFEASYSWQWHGMTVAVSTLKLEKREDTWVYRSRSEPRGIGRMFSERPTQESILRVTASGTEPLSYKADDGTSSTKRDVDVRFDWLHGHVTGVYEDTPVDIPVRAGLQDDMSVQIALMVDLLRGHPPAQVLLLDRDAVREYSYTREGEETLDTPLGRVSTVIYQSHKQGSPRVDLFWCAPAHGYIPMRVEQRRLGEVQWTMQIQKLKRD
ncbi:MAG TPA: DUF3108 domain-containing protein [Steroidobacteraceae bacterium]|nr:DUF3108 domain-containing protein [Steroidobacteraceae bacterium]